MSSVVIAGNTSGSVTLAAPDVAGTTTLTLPATSGIILTSAGGSALGTPTSGNLTNCTGYTYANLSGTVPTWNQNTTGNAASADLAYEWKGSGSNTDWDQQFRDTLAASATQIDLNSGTNCPTGGGWWFAQSFRHYNSSSYWGTQYAHGWEDKANTRYQRNVSNGGFGQWYLDDGVRAWCTFSSSGIRGSKNVSSWARQGTGQYTVNFSIAMPDTNYSSVASGGNSPDGSNIIANCVYISSSQVKCRSHAAAATQQDVNDFSIAIFR